MGHLLKSRAGRNDIFSNRLTDESTGTGSYAINVPNGGTTFITGNIIEQGPSNVNKSTIAYMSDGAYPDNPGQDLHIIGNTFVNDSNTPQPFIILGPELVTPMVVVNNIFKGPGLITTQPSAELRGNVAGGL